MIFNVPLPSTVLAPSSAGALMMEKRKARAARGKELFYRDGSRVPPIIWSARVLTRRRVTAASFRYRSLTFFRSISGLEDASGEPRQSSIRARVCVRFGCR